jgi:hypothetical protein
MTRDAKEPSLEALQTLLLVAERGEVASVAAAMGLDPAVITAVYACVAHRPY